MDELPRLEPKVRGPFTRAKREVTYVVDLGRNRLVLPTTPLSRRSCDVSCANRDDCWSFDWTWHSNPPRRRRSCDKGTVERWRWSERVANST